MLPDRHMIVPPGKVIVTGYVRVFDCELACRERMASGDVDRAYQRILQLGVDSMWPCARGHWRRMPHEPHKFVIEDGRHEWVAAVMIGRTHMLVAWLEDAP